MPDGFRPAFHRGEGTAMQVRFLHDLGGQRKGMPEYRDQGTGAGLIAFADMSLAAAGASVVYHHVKRAHDFGPLLRRLGYEEIESVWGRRLDRAGQPG